MPLTVLVWNIQEFGGRKFQGRFAGIFRCTLIAGIVHRAGADVVVIQELMRGGVVMLDDLRVQLNAVTGSVWHFDWLPAALIRDPPAGIGDLGFTSNGNHEGYAVLWRDINGLAAVHAIQTQLSAGARPAAQPPQRFIDLIRTGQTLAGIPNGRPPIVFQGPANAALDFPQSICKDLGTTANNTRSRNTVPAVFDRIQQRLQSRRPCQVLLQLGANRIVPLVVYHAPSGSKSSRSAYYGTLIGFAAAPLQAAGGTPNCVYAGDFNVKAGSQQNDLVAYATRLRYGEQSLGADESAPGSIIKYAVRGNFLTGPAVYKSTIDYAFASAPAGTGPALRVRDVLKEDLLPATASFVRGIPLNQLSMHLALTNDLGFRTTDAVYQIVFAYLTGGGYPNAPGNPDESTAAAIIYRLLISDHLPVQIAFA